MWISIHIITLFISNGVFLFSLRGLTLLELAAHLEGKAAKLKQEGLGKVKIALACMDTSSLLEILEGCFGLENLDTSQSTISTEKTEKETIVEEETPNLPKNIPATPSDSGGLATAELVFPPKVYPHSYCQYPWTTFTTFQPQDSLSLSVPTPILWSKVLTKSGGMQSHMLWSPKCGSGLLVLQCS